MHYIKIIYPKLVFTTLVVLKDYFCYLENVFPLLINFFIFYFNFFCFSVNSSVWKVIIIRLIFKNNLLHGPNSFSFISI